MPMRTKLLVAAASLALAAAASAIILTRHAEATASPTPKGNFSLAAARAFSDFPVYYAGDSFEELPLVAVQRDVTGFSNDVGFIYGTCQPTYDAGCSLSIETPATATYTRTLHDALPIRPPSWP